MKKYLVMLCTSVLLMTGCNSKELKRAEALRILKKELGYPKPIGSYIFCSDPGHVRMTLAAGLEDKGLVTVDRTQKLKDIGKPLIHFTTKAQPFLLETPEKDKADHLQLVKVADGEIMEVTGIQSGGDGKSAVVEYTIVYKNVTDFAALKNDADYTKPQTKRAYFALYDDGWRMEQANNK